MSIIHRLPVVKIDEMSGKKVLLRVDFNVPISGGVITDAFRIEKALPTVLALRDVGAKVILISHIESGEKSLRPVYEYLKKDIQLSFCENYMEAGVFENLREGDIVLCENIRLREGETANDPAFARALASLADVYINDAFAVSHRAHASIVGVPAHLPHYAGPLLVDEIAHLEEAVHPERPFVFILGGIKFDTKLPLLEKYSTIADTIFVTGALAHTFFKEEGLNIGKSVVSEGNFDIESLIAKGNIVLPKDVVVITPDGIQTKNIQDITEHDMIVDSGPQTAKDIQEKLEGAASVLWNGPLGNYEKGYKEGTLHVAEIIAKLSIKSIIGGGDTVAAIQELNLEDKFYFVSTGGGAMLDFLANETLVGVDALLE